MVVMDLLNQSKLKTVSFSLNIFIHSINPVHQVPGQKIYWETWITLVRADCSEQLSVFGAMAGVTKKRIRKQAGAKLSQAQFSLKGWKQVTHRHTENLKNWSRALFGSAGQKITKQSFNIKGYQGLIWSWNSAFKFGPWLNIFHFLLLTKTLIFCKNVRTLL